MPLRQTRETVFKLDTVEDEEVSADLSSCTALAMTVRSVLLPVCPENRLARRRRLLQYNRLPIYSNPLELELEVKIGCPHV